MLTTIPMPEVIAAFSEWALHPHTHTCKQGHDYQCATPVNAECEVDDCPECAKAKAEESAR